MLARLRVSQQAGEALAIARSLISEALADQWDLPVVRQQAGRVGSIYAYKLAIDPYRTSDEARPLTSFRVTVAVEWPDADQKMRSIELTTMKLGPRR